MGQRRPLFVYFRSFSNKQCQFFNKLMWKCPSSIWCRDSNSQPSDYESPPLTTRPGLPPKVVLVLYWSIMTRHLPTYLQSSKRFFLLGSFSLLCILGLTWIFGFTYFADGSEWLAVIFAILNSFQGVFILLFHVILNEKAKQEATRHTKSRYRLVKVSPKSLPRKTQCKLFGNIAVGKMQWHLTVNIAVSKTQRENVVPFN